MTNGNIFLVPGNFEDIAMSVWQGMMNPQGGMLSIRTREKQAVLNPSQVSSIEEWEQ